jgi:hypothetical protein
MRGRRGRGVAGSQSVSTAVHMEPKLTLEIYLHIEPMFMSNALRETSYETSESLVTHTACTFECNGFDFFEEMENADLIMAANLYLRHIFSKHLNFFSFSGHIWLQNCFKSANKKCWFHILPRSRKNVYSKKFQPKHFSTLE